MRRAVSCLVVVVLGALAGCSSDPQAAPTTDTSPSTAPAPPPGQAAELVLDLAGDTSSAAPVDGLISVGISPDGDQLLTLQNTLDRSLVLRVFPYEPGRPLTPDDGRVVMRLPHPFVHSGGSIIVTDEGDALVSLGAVEFAGEPRSAQNPDGVVVRIPARYLQDPEAPEFVPSRDDLVARGLRNPWRMTRDRQTGDLWVGDVGDGTAEEVNRIPADQPVGSPRNYGFPYVEGDTTLIEDQPAGLELTAPEWFHGRKDNPANSLIGGFVYRGSEIEDLVGRYVFSDYSERLIRSFPVGETRTESEVHAFSQDGPTGFAEDAEGELYLLTGAGDVYRLAPGEGTASDAVQQGDGNVAGPAIDLVLVGGVWPDPATRGTADATSIVVEPGGKAVLASIRNGTVSRVPLTDEPPDYCGFEVDTLPSVGHRHGDDLKAGVAASLQAYETYGEAFPSWMAADVADATELYELAQQMGTDDGWEDPELLAMMSLAAAERGPYASVAHSEQALVNLAAQRC